MTEVFFRFRGFETYTAISSRYSQPYVGFSDFRRLERQQSPEHYGYQLEGGGYLYSKSQTVSSLQDRFLSIVEVGPGNISETLRGAKNLIFVMGGSAALGDQHKDPGNRFFVQIEKQFQTRYPGSTIQVIPAAIRAFVSTQERVLFDLHILPASPKTVIFLHGYNDFSNYLYSSRPGDPYNQAVEYSRTDSRVFRAKQIIADWSAAYRWWFVSTYEKEVFRRAIEFGKNTESVSLYMKSAANIYLENVRWMAKSCEFRKVMCFFVFQPKRADGFDPISKGYAEVRSILKDQEKLNSFAYFLDLEPAFRDQAALFQDSVHMNDVGQIDLARKVVDFAAPRLPVNFWEK